MPKERILITVKTYPTLSASNGELVCTAGLREDGSWIRIYPIPFRSLEAYKKFEKYRFITANVIRNTKDPRPESHKIDITSLEIDEEMLDTSYEWRDRRKWVLLRKPNVYTNLGRAIYAANKENSLSLVTFKPSKIIDLVVEEEAEKDWDPKKLQIIANKAKQDEMFPEFQPEQFSSFVNKLPYKFSYKLLDDEGKESTMMIEDWEIGALYWNCLKVASSEQEAIEKVREKYIDQITKTDVHLFLGTTRRWHGIGKNPFVIIGVFWPPHQNQPELDLFSQ